MFVSPVERHCTAALQHNDDWLAGFSDCFEQFLLRRGEVEAGAIAAAESGNLDGHLFALELRRETNEGHDDTGFFGAGDGFVDLGLCGCFPFEGQPAAGLIGRVGILKFEIVFFRVGKVERDLCRFGEAHHRRSSGRRTGLRMEIAHRREVKLGAKIAFAEYFAIDRESIVLCGRVGKTVG